MSSSGIDLSEDVCYHIVNCLISEVSELSVQSKEFIGVLLDIAEGMMVSGAEIDRVEGTVVRMGTAFGAKKVDSFAITSSIVVTLEMPDGEVVTRTRRITSSGTTDFTRLEALNRLSREYCAEPFSVEELKKRFDT